MNEAEVLRVIVTLIFILMLILAGAWAFRRTGLGRGDNAQALRMVASQSMGNRAWVTIVEVEDARLVLGVTSQQITLLHKLPRSESAPGNSHSQHPACATGRAQCARLYSRTGSSPETALNLHS